MGSLRLPTAIEDVVTGLLHDPLPPVIDLIDAMAEANESERIVPFLPRLGDRRLSILLTRRELAVKEQKHAPKLLAFWRRIGR